MSQSKYDAFISYRRSDGAAVARWLRRELEGFRVPKSLREVYGRKLSVYLDTAYERGTSDFYEQNILPALRASRFLIVVATPDSLRRPNGADDWIEREVTDFLAGPNDSNILAVLGAGEFGAPLPGNLSKSFPNIEVVDLRGAGRFWSFSLYRVARLTSEKVKLIAPLLGVSQDEMPLLRQEEEKRQQTRLGGIVGAMLGALLAVSVLSVLALKSRNQAIQAHEDSMFAASTMAQQASALDIQDAETSRIRELIVNRGCDLLDKARRQALNDPPIDGIVLCRLERASEHERLREDQQVRKNFGEAIELARQQHLRTARIDAALSQLRAQQAYAEYLSRQKDSIAEAQYASLLEDSRRLGNEHDRPSQFALFEAEAHGQLGDRQAARGDRNSAVHSYDAAAAALQSSIQSLTAESRSPSARTIAWLVRLRRLSGFQYVQLGNTDLARDRYRESIASRGPDKVPPSVELEAAFTYANLSLLETASGNTDAARTAKMNSLNSITSIESSPESGPELKDRAAQLKRQIEN
jgi:hypothetical protein